jgi:hypothetical protein
VQRPPTALLLPIVAERKSALPFKGQLTPTYYLGPLFRFVRDNFSKISRRHRCRHAAKLAETRFHLGIG